MGMDRITFCVSLFEPDGGIDRAASQRCVLWLMETLIRINEQLLDQNEDIPRLYDAPVRYEREEIEEWQDIRHILERGEGDCEDLACWRAAELRHAGIKAGPYIKWHSNGRGGVMYHALVRWPDGRIEDPSLALGMRNGKEPRRSIFVTP